MENPYSNNRLIRLSQADQVSMADEWFDLANADHFWMIWRFRVLKKLLERFTRLDASQRFLEIGCGHGQFMQQCDCYLPITADGCDLNLFALSKIKSAKGNVFLYNINDALPEMTGRYDGIFLLDVIEHISDDVGFLDAAKKHVKPGGLVIINVPALMPLFSAYDIAAGHHRRYSLSAMEGLLNHAGLTKLYVGYWGMFLLPIAFLRKIVLRFVPKSRVIQTGFDPGTRGMNRLFKIIMSTENYLFRNPPVGTSVVAIARC